MTKETITVKPYDPDSGIIGVHKSHEFNFSLPIGATGGTYYVHTNDNDQSLTASGLVHVSKVDAAYKLVSTKGSTATLKRVTTPSILEELAEAMNDLEVHSIDYHRYEGCDFDR